MGEGLLFNVGKLNRVLHKIVRCISVLRFWRLKRGFRLIVSFSAQVCAHKVRFYKLCTLTTSGSEFGHSNKILHLKVGVSVYTVSMLSKCQG